MEREQMWALVNRRHAILERFPSAPGADREALRLVQAGQIPTSGNREFPRAEGAVFGVRGGLHEGETTFGGEFAFDGHVHIVSAHMEHGKRKATMLVNAVRKDALRAMFEEGVYVDPQARREEAEQRKKDAALECTLDYGLSCEAYAAARQIVGLRIGNGRVRPEEAEAEVARALPYVAKLMRCADEWTYDDMLRPDNATSRAIFERLTGARLPKTQKGSIAVLAGDPPPGFARGRLSSMPPCREAAMAVCVGLSSTLARTATDGVGFRHLREAYSRETIGRQLVFAAAVLERHAERAGNDEDLELAAGAVSRMRDAMAGAAGEDHALDACSLAHDILREEADRLRLAVAGHAPAAPEPPAAPRRR